MYRPALRAAAPRALPKNIQAPARRFLTTAPPHKVSRSWKNSALRWGLAGGLVYYYNTSNVFADEPAYSVHAPPEANRESETYASIDAIAEQRRAQARSQATPPSSSEAPVASPDGLEQEAEQQGAFNEETGEINWDCPCLGGMAHGPCGEQFRTAFSCFVFSKEEPKGVDCIEHFKGMQDCFRAHPEIYGAELEDAEEAGLNEGEGQGEKVAKGAQEPEVEAAKTERAQRASREVKEVQGGPTSESDEVVPKAWHDTTGANTEK